VFPVGRLDRDSAGLLVLTNDHRLGQRLTDPESHVPKRYHARVRGVPTAEALDALRQGVPLGDGTVSRPAQVRALGTAQSGTSWLEIVLTEGKNRQVRRMCANVGHDVLELVRVAVGALELGDQHFRVDACRHDAADLGRRPVADRLPEHHDSAALAGLREIVGHTRRVLLPHRFSPTRLSGRNHVALLSTVMPP